MNIVSKIAWSILGVVAIVMILSMFYPQYQEYVELQRRLQALETEFRFQEEHLQRLKRYQEQMRTDPAFVERVAREEVGFVKAGETVVKFVEDRRVDRAANEN
jgi:cell division protein FtsB